MKISDKIDSKLFLLNKLKSLDVKSFEIEKGKLIKEIEKAFKSKKSNLTIEEKDWIASEGLNIGFS